MMNISGRKRGWALPAAGIALFFILVSDTITVGSSSRLYRLCVSFALPLLFFVNGYAMKLPRDGRALARRIGQDALCLLGLPILVVFLKNLLLFQIGDTPHTAAYLQIALTNSRLSLWYAAGENVGNAQSIGLLWILIALFFERTVGGVVHVVCRSARSRRFPVEMAILLGAAFVGNIMLRTGHVLPLNLNNALGGLFFYAGGRFLHHEQRRADEVLSIGPYLAVLAGGLAGWLLPLRYGYYLNMNTAVTVWRLPSILSALCACVSVSMLIRQVCRSAFVRRFASLWGHALVPAVVFSYLDSLTRTIWATPYIRLNCILRPFFLFGLAIAVLMLLDQLEVLPIRDLRAFTNTYWMGICGVFCGVLVIGLFEGAIWSTFVTDFISREPLGVPGLNQVLAHIAMCGAEVVWALSIPRIDTLGFSIQRRAGYGMRVFILGLQVMLFAVISLLQINGVLNDDFVVLITVWMILAATGKPLRMISGIAAAELLILGFITYHLSMNGYLLYNVASGGVMGQHSFGFSTANACGVVLMMIFLLYCIARREKNLANWPWDIAIGGFALFINYRYLNSMTSLLCTALAFAAILVYRLLSLLGRLLPIVAKIRNGIIAVVGIAAYPVAMVLSIVMPYSYYSRAGDYIGRDFLQKLLGDDLGSFDVRMQLSFNALYNYPLKALGNVVVENSNSGNGTYFYIDSFFVKLLVNYGVLMTVLFFILILYMQIRSIRAGQHELVLIMSILAVYGFSESVMLMMGFNPVYLLAFAGLMAGKGRLEEKRTERGVRGGSRRIEKTGGGRHRREYEDQDTLKQLPQEGDQTQAGDHPENEEDDGITFEYLR